MIYDVIHRVLFPYYIHITVVFILTIFIILLWHYKFKSIYPTRFSDVANRSDEQLVQDETNAPTSNTQSNELTSEIPTKKPDSILTFYYVDWCPYCVKTKVILETFKRIYEGKILNNYTIICNVVDCESPTYRGKISTFPTINILQNNTTYEYEDYEITRESLYDFVNMITKL
jgi:glutaredoxin